MANVHYARIGDVWKHLSLAEVLRIGCPRRYWESHAGSSSYPLTRSPERDYAGRRGKITHVDKDPQTGAATGYILRMEEEGGNEVRFESEEIHIIEAWD